MQTIILGAGISGLTAGYKTGGTIYEASNIPGGICRSYYQDGFRFEIGGGHWIFGADDEVMSFLQKFSSLNSYTRDAGVYINKTFPYPIQSFFTPDVIPEEGTMKEWLLGEFGSDQCKLFFYPFNEKYTVGLFEHLSPQDQQKNPRNSAGYNSEFVYPIDGLDKLIDNLAQGQDIRYNKKVVNIDTRENKIYSSDGTTASYDRLISTLPLNQMRIYLGILGKEMPYTSTIVLNLGATKGVNYPKEHWLYIPFCKSGFHRVGFYSNIDESFAPRNLTSIYIEWSYINGHQFSRQNTIKELKDWGFINEVLSTDVKVIPISYTWKYPNDTTREDILNEITMLGITQIGRYGRWKFQGIAESIKEGLCC